MPCSTPPPPPGLALAQVLVKKLGDVTVPAVTGTLLSTLGELSVVCGASMKDTPSLLPLVIEILMDQSSWVKRIHALQALGKIVVSTGNVISPYTNYPQLLPFLLKALMVDQKVDWESRREVCPRSSGLRCRLHIPCTPEHVLEGQCASPSHFCVDHKSLSLSLCLSLSVCALVFVCVGGEWIDFLVFCRSAAFISAELFSDTGEGTGTNLYHAERTVQDCTFSFSMNRPKDVWDSSAVPEEFSFNRLSCSVFVLRFPTCVVCWGGGGGWYGRHTGIKYTHRTVVWGGFALQCTKVHMHASD